MENLIYVVRGQKIMLDADLAKIYGYTTKAFNQQVKRNIDKFDEDFMFQLTEQELKIISRSQNVTLNEGDDRRGSNIKYLPHAFTEAGLYMLMTVLKGELATAQSKALIRIFKGMKDYISENRVLIGTDDIAKLALQTTENTASIAKIEKTTNEEMLRKSDLPKIFKNFAATNTGKEFLILNGQLTEADVAYQGIYAKAKSRRAIIHHLCIHPDYRRHGIAAMLVEKAEIALSKEGITKVFGLVFKDNDTANAFWENQGYTIRTNLNYRNKSLNENVPQGE